MQKMKQKAQMIQKIMQLQCPILTQIYLDVFLQNFHVCKQQNKFAHMQEDATRKTCVTYNVSERKKLK